MPGGCDGLPEIMSVGRCRPQDCHPEDSLKRNLRELVPWGDSSDRQLPGKEPPEDSLKRNLRAPLPWAGLMLLSWVQCLQPTSISPTELQQKMDVHHPGMHLHL